jgi:uracil-DNA glycosylase
MAASLRTVKHHQTLLRRCARCARMIGPPVTGNPVVSPLMVVGQAPGAREIEQGRPFAWTAGKTLFGWFARIGLDEAQFRSRVYMAAVCRCYPGKHRGGDRVPNEQEVTNCSGWLQKELELLEPELIIPLGKLAIARFLPVTRLDEVIGQQWSRELYGRTTTVIPLPHPSGASTWHRTQPGKRLLEHALELVRAHPAWRALLRARD